MDGFLSEIYEKLDQDDFQAALTLAEQHEFDLVEQFLGETPNVDFYQLLLLLTLACHEIPSMFYVLKRAPASLPQAYKDMFYHIGLYEFKLLLSTLQHLVVPSTLLRVHEQVVSKVQAHVVSQLETAYLSISAQQVDGIVEKEVLLDRNWQFNEEEEMWYPACPKKEPTPYYGIERLADLTNILIQAETL